LGGGDGLAVREILKYPQVESITIVDLDPAVTKLGLENPHIRRLNKNSLHHPKVTIINQDAFTFLRNTDTRYDNIIADLPDPNNASLARLYSTLFFRMVRAHLKKSGVFVTQATSPFYARKTFWAIEKTLWASKFHQVLPYHVNVPSFGEWGFILASNEPLKLPIKSLSVETKFLETSMIASTFYFEKDLQKLDVEINTLDQPKVLDYYFEGWRYWN